MKRKFSSFFKSLVIELDRDLYGPDNHLVEWHRTLTTQETDGFQVKRPGDKNVQCTILLLLDYQPLQVTFFIFFFIFFYSFFIYLITINKTCIKT